METEPNGVNAGGTCMEVTVRGCAGGDGGEIGLGARDSCRAAGTALRDRRLAA